MKDVIWYLIAVMIWSTMIFIGKVRAITSFLLYLFKDYVFDRDSVLLIVSWMAITLLWIIYAYIKMKS